MTLLNKLGLGPTMGMGSPGLESEGTSGAVLAIIGAQGLESELAITNSLSDLKDIESNVDGLDGLHRIQSRLQNITDRVRNIATDGMTQREAQLVNDSINDINAELGAELICMPAIESFGDKISARSHTELGLESASDAMGKVWDFIIATLKKIKDMSAAWWDKFFGDVEKMKKFAEKVKSASEGYKDTKDKKKITVTGKLLYVGDTKPSGSTVKSGLSVLEATVATFIKKHSEQAEKVCDALDNAMEECDGTNDKMVSAAGKVDAAKTDVVNYVVGTDTLTEVTSTKGLMGGKHVEVSGNTATFSSIVKADAASRKAAYDAIGKVSYKVKGADGAKKADKSVEIDRFSKSEVQDIADAAIDMAKGILELRKSRQDARKYADDITKAAEGLKKDSGNLDDADKGNKTEMVAMSKAATGALKEVSGGAVASWTAHIVAVANAALKSAQASI